VAGGPSTTPRSTGAKQGSLDRAVPGRNSPTSAPSARHRPWPPAGNRAVRPALTASVAPGRGAQRRSGLPGSLVAPTTMAGRPSAGNRLVAGPEQHPAQGARRGACRRASVPLDRTTGKPGAGWRSQAPAGQHSGPERQARLRTRPLCRAGSGATPALSILCSAWPIVHRVSAPRRCLWRRPDAVRSRQARSRARNQLAAVVDLAVLGETASPAAEKSCGRCARDFGFQFAARSSGFAPAKRWGSPIASGGWW